MSGQIPFRIGELLQLQRLGDQSDFGRFNVPIYGVCGETSLISGAPRNNRRYAVVGEGQLFAARTIIGGTAYGFQTEVLFSRQRPLPYLHLRYPRAFEEREVRNSTRVSVSQTVSLQRVDATGKPSGDVFAAVAMDVSRSGMRVACADVIAAPGDWLRVAAELEVAGASHRVNLNAIVRGAGEIADPSARLACWLGLEFIKPDANQSMILSAYVNERLIAGLN